MKTDNHEVIFAIVNSGYAEDVMDVAREQGVRGGTILNARGVAREKEAAFFGITIHAEKEILMMVVEKDIKDKVLNAPGGVTHDVLISVKAHNAFNGAQRYVCTVRHFLVGVSGCFFNGPYKFTPFFQGHV